MSPETLRHAIAEAERFLRVAKHAAKGIHKDQEYGTICFASQADTAAAKRASMDLTKALSSMRGRS